MPHQSRTAVAPTNSCDAAPAGMLRDAPAALPLENGKPRVQRLIDSLQPVHLELEPPRREDWTVCVDGMVEHAIELDVAALEALGSGPVQSDFHCVWGWSRPKVNWTGVAAAIVFEAAGIAPGASHVRFAAADSPYASCVPLGQACEGWFVTGLDGEPLTAEHGGPVRWLQPPYLWGYKGVKWVCSAHVIDRVDAGPWETKVGDIDGVVPQGLIDRFHMLEEDRR